jgi:uncharacterized protein (TIGR03435 family)
MRFWALFLLAVPLAAQTPEFEVASIRARSSMTLSGPPRVCSGPKSEAENVQVNTSLSIMVAEAYTNQVDRMDLPPPARSPNFSLSVRIPPNTSIETCREMFRNLLAERIHLVTDVNPGEITTYILKVAKSGLKMKAVEGPPPALIASVKSASVNGHLQTTFRAAPASRIRTGVSALASLLAIYKTLDRGEVQDETGLTGYYDGTLEIDIPSGPAIGEFSGVATLKEALANQLGLTIDVRKTIGKVLTVRSADSIPAEN